jgi:hypothetical protein
MLIGNASQHFGRSPFIDHWRIIMYTIKPGHLLAACVAATSFALPAAAQQQAAAPPPQLERLDEGDAPTVTVTPDRKGSVVEKRIRGGRVTEIEVNRGNSTYYLRPNTQSGSAVSGDLESNRMRAPQWRIGEFDLRRPEEKKKQASEAAATTPPPPAPAAPPGN